MARRLLSGASQKLHAAAEGLDSARERAAEKAQDLRASMRRSTVDPSGVVDWSLPSSSGAPLRSHTVQEGVSAAQARRARHQIWTRGRAAPGDGQAEPGRARAVVDVGGDVEEDAEGGALRRDGGVGRPRVARLQAPRARVLQRGPAERGGAAPIVLAAAALDAAAAAGQRPARPAARGGERRRGGGAAPGARDARRELRRRRGLRAARRRPPLSARRAARCG